MSNRLKGSNSPYLLQHAENPVDWYPWGEEAFEKAGREDKPVFLSIGYSTCHWCHVMAHESFENKEIANILNQYFVSIKVDREERPDIDSVYMTVCQAFTGNGGWPMSIFMTAQQKPFFAGTYFPPASHYGMIGFADLLLAVADKWKQNRTGLLESAENILISMNQKACRISDTIEGSLAKRAVRQFCQSFDKVHGGFGSAPKFPTPHNLIFLTLYSRINDDKDPFAQVKMTLEQMRRGGIFDHIGFGFSRYSTDEFYLAPHFEKMLYDNALLILAYCAAYSFERGQGTARKPANDAAMFLDTAEKTAEYIFREMTGSDGEFYSAQDADSDGQEGKYYVWGYEEILEVLGEEAKEKFCRHFGVTRQGNFEGKNILNLLNGNEITDDFDRERKALYEYRKSRTKLHLDDKILTSWNALMICAMSVLYRLTGNRRYLLAAERAQQFIEENLACGNVLYVSCRSKVRSVKGFLDDYAYYTAALISLYEASSKPEYLERAEKICGEAGRQFADESSSGYFLYGTENASLIAKPKETYDGALPSGNSVMAYCLVRLSQMKEEGGYTEEAQKQLAFLSAEAKEYPQAHSMFLAAMLLYFNPPQKITVVLSEEDSADEVMAQMPLYADVKIIAQPDKDYRLLNGKTTYYVCKNRTCLPPSNQL